MTAMLKFIRSWRDDETPPPLLAYRSSARVIVTTVSFAIFTDIFLYGVIVPVLPFAISARAAIPENKVQFWIAILLACYGAALMISAPFCGYLADRYSNRKIPMLVGLVSLAGSTAFLCASESIALLVIGRVLQGIAAAVTWTVGSALIVDTVDKNNVGASMGWVSVAMSLSFLAAPLLGGVVYNKGGYYQVFAMCFGFIALDIALRLFIIEVKVARKWQVKNEAQQLESNDVNALQGSCDTKEIHEKNVISLPSTHVLDTKDTQEPQSPTNTTIINPTTSHPPHKKSRLPRAVQLLQSPRLLAALWGTLVHAAILTAIDTTLPLFVKQLFGFNSIGAGLMFLPYVIPAFFGPIIGAGSDRYGAKWFATGGYLISIPFLACFKFVHEDTIGHKVLLCALLFGVGVSQALAYGPLMAEVMWMVEAEGEQRFGKGYADSQGVYAQAYGLYNVSWSGGAILGPIMGGFIRDAAGWGAVGWSLAVLAAFTAVLQGVWVGGVLWKSDGKVEMDEKVTEKEDDGGVVGSGGRIREEKGAGCDLDCRDV